MTKKKDIFAYLLLFSLRCICISFSAVWHTSIPKVCVTEISNHKTFWWTQKQLFSSSVTLAGQCCVCVCVREREHERAGRFDGFSNVTLCPPVKIMFGFNGCYTITFIVF